MKKKVLWLTGVAAFVLLLAGASLLYQRLDKAAIQPPLLSEGTGISSSQEKADEKTEGNTEGEKEDETKANAGDTASDSATAPDFSVLDQDGNTVRLSDYLGQPVIVNFWASWCPPCKSEMPEFEEAFGNYKDEIRFMMINLTDGSRETAQTAADYISEQGYSFPVYYDTDGSAAIAYRAFSIPMTYFIDAEGKLAAYAAGALDAQGLQQGIDILLPSP